MIYGKIVMETRAVHMLKNNWCTADGEEGDGWGEWWGSFEDYEVDGLSAKDACCGCGAPSPCSATDWTDR